MGVSVHWVTKVKAGDVKGLRQLHSNKTLWELSWCTTLIPEPHKAYFLRKRDALLWVNETADYLRDCWTWTRCGEDGPLLWEPKFRVGA